MTSTKGIFEKRLVLIGGFSPLSPKSILREDFKFPNASKTRYYDRACTRKLEFRGLEPAAAQDFGGIRRDRMGKLKTATKLYSYVSF